MRANLALDTENQSQDYHVVFELFANSPEINLLFVHKVIFLKKHQLPHEIKRCKLA